MTSRSSTGTTNVSLQFSPGPEHRGRGGGFAKRNSGRNSVASPGIPAPPSFRSSPRAVLISQHASPNPKRVAAHHDTQSNKLKRTAPSSRAGHSTVSLTRELGLASQFDEYAMTAEVAGYTGSAGPFTPSVE
jgi:hypothetical protein